MVQAVTDILKPTIRNTVEQAIQHSLTKLHADMQVQDNHIGEAEHRINVLEEEIIEVQYVTNKTDLTIQMLLDKDDDLENRSHRNNLTIVGLPGTVKQVELQKLCEKTIPQALGINKRVALERSHRIGAPQPDRRGP